MFEDTRHPYIKYTVQGERRGLFWRGSLALFVFSAKHDEVMQDMKAMSIWGNRGVEGAVDLEIQSIRA